MAISSVKYQRPDYLQECIDYNRDCLKYILPNGSTLYHGASAHPDETIIEMVNENLDPSDRLDLVNRKNAQGYSPLSTAIIRHNKGAVNILRKSGAAFTESNYDRDHVTSHLLEAAKKDDTETIQLYFYSGLTNLEEFVNNDNR
jgi:ankyrin repeat protein